jgi:NAD-dependent SIR2 family protein deacetylase
VVLYGETIDKNQGIVEAYKVQPDLQLIAGSSLKLPGCQQLIHQMSQDVRSRDGKVVYIDLNPLSQNHCNYNDIDYHVTSALSPLFTYFNNKL